MPQRASAPTPYGGAPGQARRGPRSLNFVFLGGAAAMLLGFILPWLSINAGDALSLSWGGWQLPIEVNKLLAKLIEMAGPHAEPGDEGLETLKSVKGTATSLYAVYLIPIACLAAGIEEFIAFKKGRNTWWLRALAAASPLIAFIVVWISFAALANQLGGGSPGGPSPDTSSDVSVFDFLGVGIYISFLGFLAVVISIFVHPKPKGDAPTPYAAPRRRPRPPVPGGGPQAPRSVPGGAQPVRPRAPRPGGPTLPRPR